MNIPGLYAGAECEKAYDGPPNTRGQLIKPRTLREQLQDRIASYESQIADLREAIDALSPDVEKALNALQKIR